jgi:hypothetical protein
MTRLSRHGAAAACGHTLLRGSWPSPRPGQSELLVRSVPLLGGPRPAADQQRAGKPLSRDASPPASDHRPTGANTANAATSGRLGAPAPAPNRGQVTGDLPSNPTRGLGAGAAALCCASPAFPLAEPFPETDPSSVRSPASAVVSTTTYRHRVTFAVLRIA